MFSESVFIHICCRFSDIVHQLFNFHSFLFCFVQFALPDYSVFDSHLYFAHNTLIVGPIWWHNPILVYICTVYMCSSICMYRTTWISKYLFSWLPTWAVMQACLHCSKPVILKHIGSVVPTVTYSLPWSISLLLLSFILGLLSCLSNLAFLLLMLRWVALAVTCLLQNFVQSLNIRFLFCLVYCTGFVNFLWFCISFHNVYYFYIFLISSPAFFQSYPLTVRQRIQKIYIKGLFFSP